MSIQTAAIDQAHELLLAAQESLTLPGLDTAGIHPTRQDELLADAIDYLTMILDLSIAADYRSGQGYGYTEVTRARAV